MTAERSTAASAGLCPCSHTTAEGRSQEGGLAGGAPGFSPRPDAPGKIRTCDLCLRRAALYPLSYGRGEGQCIRAGRPADRELGAVRDLDPDVGEREARDGARDAADDVLAVARPRRPARARSPSTSSTRSVRFAWPRLWRRASGSWPGKQPLVNETARSSRPASAGRIALVDLAAPARRAGEDAQPLELVVGAARRPTRRRAPRPPARRSRAFGIPSALAEDDRRGVLLGLDLALRGDPHPRQVRAHGLAELGLGQEQEVVLAAAPDDERRDHAALRRQDQRLARLGREHVVRDDPLEQVGGVRPLHADVGARADVRLGCDRPHRG